MVITGGGWQPGETVTLLLQEDVSPLFHDDLELTAVADENGDILNTEFSPLQHDIGVRFYLTGTGQTTGWSAQTTFTDGPPKISLEQCRNGAAVSPNACSDLGGSVGWVNGNAGASQAHHLEGFSLPYRAVMENLPTGTPITVVFGYDIKHGGKHALDYLTHFDRLEPHFVNFGHAKENVDPESGVSGIFATTTTFAIPAPSSVSPCLSDVVGQPATSFNALLAGEDLMTLFGGTITNVSYVAEGCLTDAQAETQIAVSFNVGNPTAVLAWGGHIAKATEWGPGNSAGAISGSPFHMRLITWNLGNLGQQDRSLSAGAVISPGAITIVKDATPEGSTSFPFTGSPAPLTTFPLVDDGSATNTKVFSDITNFTTYTVIENTPNGWDLTGIVCVVAGANGGSQDINGATVTIDLKEGENVTCTFANTRAASLTLVKRIVNDNGGTKVVGDFGITTDAGALAFGTGVVSGSTTTYTATTLTGLSAGTKTLAESDVAGYSEGIWSCDGAGTVVSTFDGGSVVLLNGEDVTCTISNDDDAASLTVVKAIVNDDGGAAVVSAFGITTDAGALAFGTGVVSGSTTTYTATTLTGLSAGTKTLAESDVAGYSEGIWSCDGAGTVVSTFDGGSVVLLNGEDVTCTISNDDDAASLTVVKAIVNDDGGAAVVSAFGITTDAGALAFGTGVVSGSTTTYTATTLTGLSAGTKTLAESDVAGYSEGIWSCDGAGTVVSTFDGGSVVLLNGEDVTCTISNDDDAASLTVVKAIVNDDGGAAVVSAFGITTDAGALAFGTGVVSGSTTTYTATTLTGLSAGTKTLAESDVAGYSEGIWSCDGAGTVVSTFDGGSVVLLNGEDVTCTISNDDDAASLTGVKAIVNDDGGAAVVSAFGITTDAGALAFGTGVVSGSTTTYTATTLTGLSAGTKTLAESDVAGYSEGIWSCDGAGTVVSTFDGGSVVLLNGEDVACTISNDDDAASLTVVKAIVNDDGGAAVVSAFGITTDAGALAFGTGVVSGSTTTYTATTLTGLSAGTKTLAESDVAGYSEGIWSCDGAGTVVSTFDGGSVVLLNGEDVTCTISNDDDAASLTVVKAIVNDDGGAAVVSAFGITTDAGAPAFGTGVVSGSTTTYTATTLTGLSAGTKTLAESDVAGYSEGIWSCDGAGTVVSTFDGGSVVLLNGEDVTCTITNDDIPGTLIIQKVAVGIGLQTAEFDFEITPPVGAQFTETIGCRSEIDAHQAALRGWKGKTLSTGVTSVR